MGGGAHLFLFELLFVTGGVLAWAVWEWVSVERERKRDRARRVRDEE